MLCLRVSCAAIALVALTVTGQTQPGPVGQAQTSPLVAALMPSLGSETLQKELKLTEDQTKKLAGLSKTLSEESFNTAPKDLDNAKRNKAIEAEFQAVLNADQLKRARQIAAQIVWTDRFFRSTATLSSPTLDPRRASTSALSAYPELAAALKLDETQKQLVQLGSRGSLLGSTVFLTAEQTKAARELLGEPYKAGSLPRFGGGFGSPFGRGFAGGGGFGGSGSQVLQYTAAKDVQKELKLTDEQIKGLGELRRKYDSGPGRSFEEFQNTSPAARQKARAEQLAEAEKAIERILTADQRKRLAQIDLQQNGPDTEFFEGSELGTDLNVTADQRKKFADINATKGEEFVTVVISGQPAEKVKVAVEAIRKDRDNAVRAILTRDQQAKLKELVGEPFVGNAYPDDGFRSFVPPTLEFTFGRYTTQLTMLNVYPGVREELKFTEEQTKKVQELARDVTAKFPARDLRQLVSDAEKAHKVYGERSALVEKALAELLTKEQQARFRELMLQQLESRALRQASVPTAASYPGVAEAIKLTADQRKKLIAGDSPAVVLTDDQKQAIKGMLGKPADVATVFGRVGFPGRTLLPTLSPTNQLLLNTGMWDALKLTPEQVGKLVPAANEYTLATGRFGGFGDPRGGANQPPSPEKAKAAVEAFGKTVESSLTADQKKRLDQLGVQQSAADSLYRLLTASSPNRGGELAKTLGITPEQGKTFAAVSKEITAVAALLDPQDFVPFEKAQAARMKLRDRLDALLMKELTADQQAKWKELVGEPHPGIVKQPLDRFGGRGGFTP